MICIGYVPYLVFESHVNYISCNKRRKLVFVSDVNIVVSEPIIANAFVNPMADIIDTSFPSVAFHLPDQVILIKLDGTNFLAWSAQLIPLFRSYGLIGIIDGYEPSLSKFST